VGVMMAPVLRLNLQHPPARQIYSELAAYLGLQAEDLPAWWEELLSAVRIPYRISAHGATAEHLPDLSEFAAKQWTGAFNPVPVDAGVFERLYGSVL
jgi:alcohol dehydrogenase class IV